MTTHRTDLPHVIPCGFMSFADDGSILFANQTLLNMLGYDAAELASRHIDSILTMPARIFYQTHFFPLIKLHGKAEEIYFSLRAKDGSSIPVFANAARGDYEGVTANHCAFMALNHREKYEDELLKAKRTAEEALQRNKQLVVEAEAARAEAERANRAKSSFLATMSHEIRTPINAIMGYAQLLEIGLGDQLTERQQSFVDGVQAGSRHLLTIINDVLDLAKIESGSMTVRAEPELVELAIEHSAAMIEPQAAARGVRLRTAPHEEGLMYCGDHDRVAQILINLLSNAVKFTDQGGRITVEAGRKLRGAASGKENVYIKVADTGVGMSPELQTQLFEPFVQAETSASQVAQGTGLGLAISRRFARLMDGDLTVESELGKGSEFTLWLPRA